MTFALELQPRCPDCGAGRSEPHGPACDVARCVQTGLQRLGCEIEHDHGDDRWVGSWPGEADAVVLGLFSRLEPGQGWVRCSGDDPDASPDLNTLMTKGRWDPASRSWSMPDDPAGQ